MPIPVPPAPPFATLRFVLELLPEPATEPPALVLDEFPPVADPPVAFDLEPDFDPLVLDDVAPLVELDEEDAVEPEGFVDGGVVGSHWNVWPFSVTTEPYPDEAVPLVVDGTLTQLPEQAGQANAAEVEKTMTSKSVMRFIYFP